MWGILEINLHVMTNRFGESRSLANHLLPDDNNRTVIIGILQ